MGATYRALRARFGEGIDIQVVDPRNAISWLPMAITDMWRSRRTLRFLPPLLLKLKPNAVIIDGELVFAGLPEAEAVVSAVEQLQAGRERR